MTTTATSPHVNPQLNTRELQVEAAMQTPLLVVASIAISKSKDMVTEIVIEIVIEIVTEVG